MEKPEISVVIPILNTSVSLQRCLEALSKQKTSRSFEVVVVDDGSTESLERVRKNFENRLNLKWHRFPVNRGPAVARNRGIELAEGEVILFTDADCRPEPEWIETLSQPFDDPHVSGVKGIYKSDQFDIWARLSQLEFEERYECLARSEDIDFIDTYCGGYRRRDLLAIKGFDETFPKADNEDVDLSFRIKKLGGKYVFVPRAIVWHQHREGLLNYVRLKFGRGYWRMRVYRKHPYKAGRDSYTPWTLKVQLMLLLLIPLAICTRKNFRRWSLFWLVTCVPLLRLTLRKDPILIPLVPFFYLVRGVSLLFGIVAETKDFHRHSEK